MNPLTEVSLEEPKRRIPALILAAGLLTLSVMTGAHAAGVGGHPKAHDGMNAAEEKRAMRALQRSERSAASVSSLQVLPSEPQMLLMERRRDKGATARHADAWYYNYKHNETIHKVVDLTSGEVISSEVVIGTQLPLIEAEITRAFDILLASTPHRRALKKAYEDVTGEHFEDRSQVSYKAFVFHPDTVADGLDPAARRCGVHRCAQMLIYTHDNIALDTSPVVDLSSARVLQNLELRAREIVRRGEAAL